MVRSHRPRNSSASCGSFSALANDGSLVLIGGVGAAGVGVGVGGGFLDKSPAPALTAATEFEPSVGRLQRNVSLPGTLRENGGVQGQAFVFTPPSSGLEGGGGYFSAVSTPAGGGGVAESVLGGGRAGRGCSGEDVEGKKFGRWFFW